MITLSTLCIIFGILVIHWVADFVLQTDEQAKGKSKDMECLLAHTCSYTLFWLLCSIIYSFFIGVGVLVPILFCIITFLAHTLTDYFTSRLNSRLWGEGRVHDFFVSVGFDQVLHYGQLFLTFYLLY